MAEESSKKLRRICQSDGKRNQKRELGRLDSKSCGKSGRGEGEDRQGGSVRVRWEISKRGWEHGTGTKQTDTGIS